MNRVRLITLTAIVALVAIAGAWYVGKGDAAARTAVAERGTINVTIQTVGTLQIDSPGILRANAGGVVEHLGVDAGEIVTEGDIIAILDRELFDRAIEVARDNLEQAEFALQFAEERAREDSADRHRAHEVLTARLALKQAQRELADAEETRRNSVIVAPRDGRLIELIVQPGDAVTTGQPLATVASREDLELVADVDELDLPNVRSDTLARFRVDAYPATEITGRVIATAPAARLQGGTSVFATRIGFDPPQDLDLRAGMNASVTIVTDARSDVLLVPESALTTIGERTYVTVVTDQGHESREVVLGYRGDGQVEVVSGLSEGDEVVVR